jgi:hypothetical protein
MSRPDGPARPPVDAGPFRPWLEHTEMVLAGSAEAVVPCDGCTACCESSQFVLVEPDEHDARLAIPSELLFPAPGMDPGFSLIPHDEHGRCAMFRDGGCSIYPHRPRACRAYDCRVLVAADVDPGPEKAALRERVGRWRFTLDGDADERALGSVRAAATYLATHGPELPGGSPPPTQRAALAVELAGLFAEGAPTPTVHDVAVAIRHTHGRG